MIGTLSGLRVVDFTTTIAGPYCTRLLADLGADVVKIEAPQGDVLRSSPPLRNHASLAFGQLNAGKRSVKLDLKRSDDVEVARRLAGQADVLVENFRPGVMARLGLDFNALSDASPRLIYCAISGYGQTGPSAELPAYAPVIHAASGYDRAYQAYQPGRTTPDQCGIFTADILAGTYALSGILAALHRRHTTGLGQLVDVSMFESMLALLLNDVQRAQLGTSSPPIAFQPFATADDAVMIALVSPKNFIGVASAASRPDWLSLLQLERLELKDFMNALEAWTRTQTSDACLALLRRYGVPCSAYRSVAEALNDPQIAHRGALCEVQDSEGAFRVVAAPFHLSRDQPTVGQRVPGLGEHTHAVRASAEAGRWAVKVGA
ncbi:MAG: CoA transferase [Sphingopyxis sp.]|nr:CoA transferase [Sphingopyxis sp.]